jgi:hypothetical protein
LANITNKALVFCVVNINNIYSDLLLWLLVKWNIL